MRQDRFQFSGFPEIKTKVLQTFAKTFLGKKPYSPFSKKHPKLSPSKPIDSGDRTI